MDWSRARRDGQDRRPRLPDRRHGGRAPAHPGRREGAHPGLQRRGDRPQNGGRPRDVHGPPDRAGRGRRAHLPAALAEDRQDRGEEGRRGRRRAKLYYLRDRVGKATKIRDDVKRQTKIDADLKARPRPPQGRAGSRRRRSPPRAACPSRPRRRRPQGSRGRQEVTQYGRIAGRPERTTRRCRDAAVAPLAVVAAVVRPAQRAGGGAVPPVARLPHPGRERLRPARRTRPPRASTARRSWWSRSARPPDRPDAPGKPPPRWTSASSGRSPGRRCVSWPHRAAGQDRRAVRRARARAGRDGPRTRRSSTSLMPSRPSASSRCSVLEPGLPERTSDS